MSKLSESSHKGCSRHLLSSKQDECNVGASLTGTLKHLPLWNGTVLYDVRLFAEYFLEH